MFNCREEGCIKHKSFSLQLSEGLSLFLDWLLRLGSMTKTKRKGKFLYLGDKLDCGACKFRLRGKLLTSLVALFSIGKRVKKNQYLPCYIIPLLSLILDYCKREKGERVSFSTGVKRKTTYIIQPPPRLWSHSSSVGTPKVGAV